MKTTTAKTSLFSRFLFGCALVLTLAFALASQPVKAADKQYTMSIGETMTLKNTYSASSATYYAYNWFVDDSSIVSESHANNSSSTTITALKAGTTTVTATLDYTVVTKVPHSYYLASLRRTYTYYSNSYKSYSKELTFEITVSGCTSHNWNSGTVTTAATASSAGVKTYTCTKCGATKTETIPKLTDSSSSTGALQENQTFTSGKLKYKVTSVSGTTGTAKVIGATSKTLTSISIPSTVSKNGVTLTVTAISASSFKGMTKLKKVSGGAQLKVIGKNAFYGCTELKTVSISSTKLNKINSKAFYGCGKLTTVTLKTTKLTAKTVGDAAFKGIKSTCTFKVPASKVSAYKKIFKAKGASSKITVKKF